jgi:hypothetical protein
MIFFVVLLKRFCAPRPVLISAAFTFRNRLFDGVGATEPTVRASDRDPIGEL